MASAPAKDGGALSALACPNPDCSDFNRFGAGNLSVVERMGKDKAIRRLYCKTCGQRFSERQGSLLEYTKLPKETVVRILKCLAHGCSEEATADICEVTPKTVRRLLRRAGPRAEDFHRLQLERLQEPIEAVEMDEQQARVSEARKKGATDPIGATVQRVAAWVESGFMSLWL
jgi:transposase-like protein